MRANYVRVFVPIAASLLPVAFFISIIPEGVEEPNGLIHLAFAGTIVLAAGLVTLGVGMLRGARDS